jgi:signal transduction histidine kinase
MLCCRCPVLDDLGLQSALRSLCTAAAAADAVSPEVELVVYRVAQESLTTVIAGRR